MNSLKSSKFILSIEPNLEKENVMGFYREGLVLSLLVQWATGKSLIVSHFLNLII